MSKRNKSSEPRVDGWENVLTGLGYDGRDKRLYATVAAAPMLREQELSELYSGDGMARRIVDLPASEMTREWITFTCDDDDADTAKKVTQALQTLGAQTSVFQAIAWARLFGGGVIVLGADDGFGQSLAQPLNMANIKSLRWLTVMDRWSLRISKRYEMISGKYGEPELYEIQNTVSGGSSESVLGQQIHESRVIRFDGPTTTRLRKEQNDGWCDPVFTSVIEVLRDFWTGFDGAAHILSDFAQGVFKMKGLAQLIASNQTEVVLRRLQALDLARSIVRAAVLDSEEEFKRESTSVAGLPDMLDRLVSLLSSVTGIPTTLLMGQSPAGLNATGASDIRFFYDRIKSDQETMVRPRLESLIRVMLLAKDGPTGGVEPENWSFRFNPLWQLTEAEKVEMRNKQAQTDQIYVTQQVLHPEEVRASRFGGDTYSLETSLDEDLEAVETMATEEEPERKPALEQEQGEQDIDANVS